MTDDIEQIVDDFNSGWTAGNFEVIDTILHDEVVFVAPDLKTKLSGKPACLQSIKDYVSSAKTKVFEVKEKDIQIWNQTAVISIDYYIEYEMNDESYRERGLEFWTLEKADKWQMVWLAMVKNEVL